MKRWWCELSRLSFLWLRSVVVLCVLVLSLAALSALQLSAQVTETPVAFDNTGRVMALTRIAAARLDLGPPAWPVVGDFTEARLFRRSDGVYVLAVSLRDGSVERYELTQAAVDALRYRVDTMPAGLSLDAGGNAGSRFVLNQSVLGLAVYAPAFSVSVTNAPAGRVTTYLLVAGGTFFAASQLARDIGITGNMNALSTHMAARGALAGAGLTYATGMSSDAVAAGVFVGGLGGTAAGLMLGRDWSNSEVSGARAAADVFTIAGLGIARAVRGESDDGRLVNRTEAAIITGFGAAGYVGGRWYGANASHNMTGGDAGTLWITGTIGTMAASIPLWGRDISDRSRALALTGGYLAGVAAGDLLLSRRFDLTGAEAGTMALGSVAGSLVSLGIAQLINPEEASESYTMSFATAGSIGGLFLTHYLLAPQLDGGNMGRDVGPSRLELDPTAVALTAAGVPGRFTLLSLHFR